MMRFLLFAAVLVSLAGCSSSTGPELVECRGTLLKDGQPLDVAQRDIGVGMVTLTFVPVEASGPAPQTFGANADAQGKFTIPGGMLPGKYKVAVRQWDPYPNVDKLNGAFAEEKTPLVRDVDGKSEINIDLAMPN
jgi:hypothetical protein